jgi:hypothetical protein
MGGFLLQRNVLHCFSPWAQFLQPEEQELRPCRNGKRKILAKNCALGANPKCPWKYPGGSSSHQPNHVSSIILVLDSCMKPSMGLSKVFFATMPWQFSIAGHVDTSQ